MPVADAPVAAGGGLWLLLGVLLPVLAVTATAFAKITVVLGALRGGLGLQGGLQGDGDRMYPWGQLGLTVAPQRRDG